MRAAVGPPVVTVAVDGSTLSGGAVDSLAEVRVSRRLSQPAQCVLTFAHRPGSDDGLTALRPGAALRLAVEPDPSALFSGDVTGAEVTHGADGSCLLRVRAYDALHRLRQRHAGRSFVDVSVRELADELLGGGAVAGVEGPRRDVVAGSGDTDLELLTRHAHRSGLYLVDDGGSLRTTTLDGFGRPIHLRLGGGVHEVAVDHDAHRAVTEVRATAWRPADAALVHASVPVHGDGDGDGDGRGVPIGWAGPRQLVDVASSDPAELDAIAAGEAARAAAGRRVVRAVVEGRADLVPGRRITLADVPGAGDRPVVITESVATIDRHGFLVRLSTEPPAPLPAPVPTTVSVGEVTEIDDPEGRGRVRVRLPLVSGAVTPWAGVVVAGAGAGRGVVALPDVGDQVAVALLDGDPSRPLVLGGLYGQTAPSDQGVVGGRRGRLSLGMPSGASVVVDDDAGRLQLRHPNGSCVELGPESSTVRSAVPLTIDAAGQPVTIRARTVDFEEVR